SRSPGDILAVSLLVLTLTRPMSQLPGPGHLIGPLLCESRQLRRPFDRFGSSFLADLVMEHDQVGGLLGGERRTGLVLGARLPRPGARAGAGDGPGWLRRGEQAGETPNDPDQSQCSTGCQ